MSYSLTSFLERYQKKIIFSCVAFFALHWIFFIWVHKINVPYSMEFLPITIVYDFMTTEISLVQELFTPSLNNHILGFSNLVSFPNLYFNSFDVVNMYFLEFPVYVGVLFFTYLLIKKTDRKLLWLLIPTSAFVFNPLMSSSDNFFTGWHSIVPQLAIISVIFLFNKKTVTITTFVICIILGIIATFSSLWGIVIWMAGIFSLINYKSEEKKLVEKKWLFIWIAILSIVGFVYYQLYPESGLSEIGKSSPFSIEGLSFITTFLSAGFRLKFEVLMVLVGSASILFSIFCISYFIKLKKISSIKPWLNFLLVGISIAVVVQLGRGHLSLHLGNEPYYIYFSQFFQIGLLVLIGFLILNLKDSIQKNRIKALVIFLLVILVTQSILLIPSYYTGWTRADHYFENKLYIMECYSLSNDPDCLKSGGSQADPDVHEFMNYFLENNFSFFSEKNFNLKNKQDMNFFKTVWSEKPATDIGLSEIESINDSLVFENETFMVEEPLVTIKGWSLDENKKQLDSIYLIVDDAPFLKYDHFYPRNDISENLGMDAELNSGWSISFLSGYLEENCQLITLVGIKDDKKIGFVNEIELCKN
mgnify:FL=1